MTEQRRDYLPDNQSTLFIINKRFFDRPVEVKMMLRKAEENKIWPSEGETVRILKRLAVLEDLFWEKRYQPLSTLQKYVTEVYNLSIELTTLEVEQNSKGKKSPAICATISFTGLVNIFVISVTTRQLVVRQPWKNEAEEVKKAMALEADDPQENEPIQIEYDQDMVVENEIVFSNEGLVLEKVSTESVEGLDKVRIAKEKAVKLKRRIEGNNQDNEDQTVSKTEIEKLAAELKMSERRYDKTLESFESQMIQIRVDLEDEVRTKNQKIANMMQVLEDYGNQVGKLWSKVTKRSSENFEEKSLQATTKVSQAAKMSLRGTLPKSKEKDKVLLSTKSRLVNSREGDKDKVTPKEVKRVAKTDGARKVIREVKDTRIVYEPGTSKGGELKGVRPYRSLSGSTVSIPDLEKLDSQRIHLNVSDDSLSLGIDEDISEFEIEHLQNAALEKEKLDKAEAAVRAEELESDRKQNEIVRQKGIAKMNITRKSFVKQKQAERKEKRKGLEKVKEGSSSKLRLSGRLGTLEKSQKVRKMRK